MMRGVTAATIVALSTATAHGESVWTVDTSLSRTSVVNERLRPVPFTPVRMNHELLTQTVAEEKSVVEFIVDGEILSCTLSSSGVMHPDLAAKFPTLKSLSGTCTNNVDVSLTMQTDKLGSAHLTFYSETKGTTYVDGMTGSDNSYMIYTQSDAKEFGDLTNDDFKCGVTSDDEVLRALDGLDGWDKEEASQKLRGSSRNTQGAITGTIFRIAMLNSPQYGAFHGNTPASVLAAIVDTMTRVNGVYLRELGVFFQLIAENDRIICAGESYCSDWPNTSALLNQNQNLMNGRGITTSMYDIGHSVSTASGGVAGYPAFCTGSKARGTTGVTSPIGDPFWIDYVAHEIGHQLLGAHSFRDCNGANDGNLMNEGAVEPGSGVTIMGYAGICGSRNIASNSVPHFNSINLEAMAGLVENRVNGGCGETFTAPGERPVMDTFPGICVVPKGNYVQLAGRVTNLNADEVKYAWDRVDLGYKDFLSDNVPRFRPWAPTNSPRRFLPNMYYLTYGLSDRRDEIPPNAAVNGDETMTFRFIGRTRYSTDAESTSFEIDQIGAFSFVDRTLRYSSSESPIEITSSLNSLTVGETTTVSWTGGTLSSNLEVLIAVNTIEETNNFNYENDIKDLEWVSVAVETSASGSATFVVPQLADSSNARVNLMVRSTGSEDCYFFDMVPNLTFIGGTDGTAPPTNPTTTPPTATVTNFPTQSPTTGAPTSAWRCPASWFDASDGCDCECGGGDPDCEEDGPLWCAGQSTNPDLFTCDATTDTCVDASGRRPEAPSGEFKEGANSSAPIGIIAAAGSAVLVVAFAIIAIVQRRRSVQASKRDPQASGSVVSPPDHML